MRVNLVNQAILLTRPLSQVLFFFKFNVENNFAALFFILFYIFSFRAKITCKLLQVSNT